MNVENLSNLSEEEFAEIKSDTVNLNTLGQVLNWVKARPVNEFLPQVVAETIPQDEYTIDVIIPFRNVYLVFDTT